ncbi:hypothetical protein HPP92_006465 [Vanilla planifolia]|uniref:RING-type E3 ubiquitin transferase n=1 Tax=Vanilla planifolia TaxID=51239 RepID=A0A835RWK2_VANPL|nr:hypothetical protein HPP92_006465 [Vanilla planifolia]
MGSTPSPTATQTVVAIDKDRYSQQAVKWTIDHLLVNNHTVIFLHVRRPPSNSHYTFAMAETTTGAAREQFEAEMSQLFLPIRGFCARNGVQLREVVLEETDISKAIVDYVTINNIHNVVLGASSRNALTRKFKNPDVPSIVAKSAPDFCAVYVIYKGKPVSVRSARGPPPANYAQLRQSLPPLVTPNTLPESDDAVKTPFGRGNMRAGVPPPHNSDRRFIENDQMRAVSRLTNPLKSSSLDSLDIYSSKKALTFKESLSEDFDVQGNMCFKSPDFSEIFEQNTNNTTDPSSPTLANRDIEAEMQRLKLELKQTIDMYSTACKEAITAKQQARELHNCKMEEAKKVEQARHAEETALALVEVEKAKSKAAIEAAQAAQRIAELEAQKRLHAELKAKQEAEEKMRALNALAQNDHRYRRYNIDEIEVATEYFSESLKIGEGGYGPVYRASLDHTPVAIKVLSPDATHGRKQFQQEVEVLSCIRHPNMVLLLGACPEYGCLVYEFMDNGSLEDRLFRRGNTPSIPWSVRFKIAAEIATGLLFLHQAKPEPLVHRDLKPANILLDRNYTSKISDVGLSRLVPPSVADKVTQYRLTSTAGTFCYIDPEYQQTGMLGTKSDIYSLGVLLLQIVTAKPPMGLSHHVERAIDRGTFAELLDPTVTDWPMEGVVLFAKLALKCSELRRKDRPDLGSVILPELNRLRSLGHAYEAHRSSSSSSYSNSINSSSSSSNSSNDGRIFNGMHQ